MRRIPRHSLRVPQLGSVEPICVFCQTRPLVALPSRRSFSCTPSQSQKLSFLERTRRRIWGTESPPGFDDPYTGQNFSKGNETIGDEDINYEKEEWQKQINLATKHPEYVPAQTWDGLEIVGGDKDNQTGDVFENFLGQGQITSPEGVRVALHRALVEVYTLCSANLSLRESLPDAPLDPLQDGTALFESVTIKPSTDGQGASLNFTSDEHRQEILSYISDTEEPISERRVDDRTDSMRLWAFNKAQILEKGKEWFPISIRDPQIKFAIHKRLSQLIGHAISDPLITKANTAGELYVGLLAQFTKPLKLHQEIQFGAGNALAGLDNVQVHERKQSSIDKERRIGRLKVINRELERQGLPLMGERINRD